MCENSCRDDLRHVFALLGTTFSCVFCLGFNIITFFFSSTFGGVRSRSSRPQLLLYKA